MDTGTSELKTKIPPGMRLKDKRPCSGLRADLKTCVLASDCVKKVNIFKKIQRCMYIYIIIMGPKF